MPAGMSMTAFVLVEGRMPVGTLLHAHTQEGYVSMCPVPTQELHRMGVSYIEPEEVRATPP